MWSCCQYYKCVLWVRSDAHEPGLSSRSKHMRIPLYANTHIVNMVCPVGVDRVIIWHAEVVMSMHLALNGNVLCVCETLQYPTLCHAIPWIISIIWPVREAAFYPDPFIVVGNTAGIFAGNASKRTICSRQHQITRSFKKVEVGRFASRLHYSC